MRQCMFAIITYDIPTDQDGKKRYSKIHKLCGRCGFWVNNSVFEFDMDYTSFLRLKHNIEQIIDSDEDSVRIYIIGKKRTDSNTIILGKKALVESDEQTFIL